MIKKFLLYITILWTIGLHAQPPAGYYDSAVGKTCAALKTALKQITAIGNNPQTYSALWSQYLLTDIKPRTIDTGSANVIYDIYSAVPGGTDPYQFTPGPVASGGQQDNGTMGTAEGQLYNKEHSVPKSWFSGNTSINGVATDYLFIYPTDKKVNGSRGDIPYGVVATPSKTFMNGTKMGSSAVAGVTGNVFEPIDSFKGDVARSFLYFVTRYEDNMPTWNGGTFGSLAFDTNTYPSIKVPYIIMMLNWHHLDQVSQKEIIRNNGAFSFQGNRNPYIDHPEYVDLVWNSTCAGLQSLPVGIIYFTGKYNAGRINLNWMSTQEVDLKEYTIERSLNNGAFLPIANIAASAKPQYSYTDINEFIPGAVYQYRLKSVNDNGSFQYSDIFSITIPVKEEILIYPNPASNNITCILSSVQTSATLQLVDPMGNLLLQKTLPVNNGSVSLPVNNIHSGQYILKIITGNKLITRQVTIIQ